MMPPLCESCQQEVSIWLLTFEDTHECRVCTRCLHDMDERESQACVIDLLEEVKGVHS